MVLRTYPECNAFILKAFVKTMAITDLILVHVLIVNLKRVGGQLLCLVQFPTQRRGKKRINTWNNETHRG